MKTTCTHVAKFESEYSAFLTNSRDFLDGELGNDALQAALLARDIGSRLVVWDEGSIPWQDADLVLIRSTWDYQSHLEKFLAWAKKCHTKLVHGTKVFSWNTHRFYLVALRDAGVPIVPSLIAEAGYQSIPQIAFAGPYVVKPLVGASGGAVLIINSLTDWQAPAIHSTLVQPFMPSILEEGEMTVFVVADQVTSQLQKLPV